VILAVAVTDVAMAAATAAACSSDVAGAMAAACSPECDASSAHYAMVDCLADATQADAATLVAMPVAMLVAVATSRS
jgi:hypothetical protein